MTTTSLHAYKFGLMNESYSLVFVLNVFPSFLTQTVRSELDRSSSSGNSHQKAPVEKPSNRELSMDTAKEKRTKSLSSSPTDSPVASLECDPEVKEGFLCLSEEDEGQAEQDDSKKEKMDVDLRKVEKTDTETGCTAADGTGNGCQMFIVF